MDVVTHPAIGMQPSLGAFKGINHDGGQLGTDLFSAQSHSYSLIKMGS